MLEMLAISSEHGVSCRLTNITLVLPFRLPAKWKPSGDNDHEKGMSHHLPNPASRITVGLGVFRQDDIMIALKQRTSVKPRQTMG